MSSSEIDAVRELLRSKPRPASFPERRERLDAIGSTSPLAGDIKLEPIDANGVPAEWSLAPGSDASKGFLFFHGGGYCSGSVVSPRRLGTEDGRAGGAHARSGLPASARASIPCGDRGCALGLSFPPRSRRCAVQDCDRRR